MLKSFESTSSTGLTTIVLLEGDMMNTESDVILKIAKRLPGVWRFFSFFIIVPKPVRDGMYRFIARHRYHLFGRRETCMVPTAELMDKFI